MELDERAGGKDHARRRGLSVRPLAPTACTATILSQNLALWGGDFLFRLWVELGSRGVEGRRTASGSLW
jgi:hypothetical protein